MDRALFSLALVGACADKPSPQDSAPPASGDMAALATISSDYAVAALALASLDDRKVNDGVTDLPADVAIGAAGGEVVVLGRYGFDSLRLYTPGQWQEPRVELALEDGANPHEAARCAGALFVSQYDLPRLAVFDPASGLLLGAVDLSAYADADGLPEASTLAVVGERLYVGLQNLARDGGWFSVGGHVVEVDCASRAATRAWPTPGETAVYANPADPERLLVSVLESGLHVLDVEAGTLGEALIPAAAEGLELLDLAARGETAVAIAADADFGYAVACLDLARGALTVVETPASFLYALSDNDRGEAWIAARRHWEHPDEAPAYLIYDIEGCAPSGRVETLLEPAGAAFY